jgi:hypothetical protein
MTDVEELEHGKLQTQHQPEEVLLVMLTPDRRLPMGESMLFFAALPTPQEEVPPSSCPSGPSLASTSMLELDALLRSLMSLLALLLPRFWFIVGWDCQIRELPLPHSSPILEVKA